VARKSRSKASTRRCYGATKRPAHRSPLIKFRQGRPGIPQPHLHSANQFMFLPERQIRYTATKVCSRRGAFYCNPKGNVHGPAIAHEETVVVETTDGPHYPQKPSWYADERDAH